jgi:hypothetical protein
VLPPRFSRWQTIYGRFSRWLISKTVPHRKADEVLGSY